MPLKLVGSMPRYMVIDRIRLDLLERELCFGCHCHPLTCNEFYLVHALIRQYPRFVSREALLCKMKRSSAKATQTVTSVVNRLRGKFGDDLISRQRNHGYSLNVTEAQWNT